VANGPNIFQMLLVFIKGLFLIGAPCIHRKSLTFIQVDVNCCRSIYSCKRHNFCARKCDKSGFRVKDCGSLKVSMDNGEG